MDLEKMEHRFEVRHTDVFFSGEFISELHLMMVSEPRVLLTDPRTSIS